MAAMIYRHTIKAVVTKPAIGPWRSDKDEVERLVIRDQGKCYLGWNNVVQEALLAS